MIKKQVEEITQKVEGKIRRKEKKLDHAFKMANIRITGISKTKTRKRRV